MDTKIVSGTLTVVITFMLTALNTGFAYLTQDRGTIGISRPTALGDRFVAVVSIENYSREFIREVALEIPASVNGAEIRSDAPLQVVDSSIAPGQRTRLVKLNEISPRMATRVFIPLASGGDAAMLRAVNAEAAGLTVRHDEELESPLLRALKWGLIAALTYSVAAFLLGYYISRRIAAEERKIEKLEKKNDEVRRELDTAKVEAEGQRDSLLAEIRAVDARDAKRRLLLMARLSDYAKELAFWRDTVRALVLKSGEAKAHADALIAEVTERLQTYGTRTDRPDFEAVRVAAAWLKESEKSK